MTRPSAEGELTDIQQARICEATAHIEAIAQDLDADGLQPEEVAAMLLAQAYLIMSRHYTSGAIYDWANEGVRTMMSETRDHPNTFQMQ